MIDTQGTLRHSAALASAIATAPLLTSTAFAEPAQAGVSSATGTPSVLPRPDYKFADKSKDLICKGER